MTLPVVAVPTMISGSTVFPISRASYFFAGPDSPANRRYPLADVEGTFGVGPIVGAPWSVYANLYLGTPKAPSTTYVVDAWVDTASGTATLNATNAGVPPNGVPGGGATLVGLDVPRNLTYVSSGASDTSSVTVTGYDQYGALTQETVTLDGETAVVGKKAFLFIQSVVTILGGTGATLSVGSGDALGLPVALDAGNFDAAVKVVSGTQSADAGTLIFADRTSPATASSGDVRGTYTPAVTLNGTDEIFVRGFPAMGGHFKTTSTFGVEQF